jgi:hypothetical protein
MKLFFDYIELLVRALRDAQGHMNQFISLISAQWRVQFCVKREEARCNDALKGASTTARQCVEEEEMHATTH